MGHAKRVMVARIAGGQLLQKRFDHLSPSIRLPPSYRISPILGNWLIDYGMNFSKIISMEGRLCRRCKE